jgi:PAS domain-containing protein
MPTTREWHASSSTGKTSIIGKRVEVSGLRADGTEFPMELTISALLRNGKYIFSAYARDISLRKQAEDQLRQAAQRFSSVFNSSPIAASIATAEDGRFIQVNRNYQRDFGWTNEDLIGRSSVEVGLWGTRRCASPGPMHCVATGACSTMRWSGSRRAANPAPSAFPPK